MNVCLMPEFCVDRYIEGTNRVTFDIAEYLISKGHKVTIVFPKWKYIDVEKYRKPWNDLGVELVPARGIFLENPFFRAFFYFLNAAKVQLKEKQDVFFSYYTIAPMISVWLLKKVFGVKAVAGIWEPNTVELLKKKKFLRHFLSGVSKIQTLSESVKKSISRECGIKEGKIKAVFGHVDEKMFFEKPKNKKLLNELGFSEKDFIVLFAGRVSELKGATYLLKAMALTDERVKAVFVGRFGDSINYNEMASKLGLKNRVKFAGYLEKHSNLNEYFSVCDIFCLPSNSEGFGIVFAEAFSCGKPVISSDVEPLPEVVGDAGLIAKRNSPESIAEAIEKLFLDKKLYKKLQENARKRAKLFGKEKVMKEYEKLLLE